MTLTHHIPDGSPRRAPMVTVDLSIDFDFFVRELPQWEWGHGEGTDAAIGEALWTARYAQLDLLPETNPTLWADFVPEQFVSATQERGLRWDLNRSARVLCVADSHRWAADFFVRANPPADLLLNFDAHHDAYGLPPSLKAAPTCDDWLGHYWHSVARVTQLVQVYPKWKDAALDGPLAVPATDDTGAQRGRWCVDPKRRPVRVTTWAQLRLPPNAQVRHVFLCRSAPWVAPHHDECFLRTVHALRAASAFHTQPEPLRQRAQPDHKQIAQLRALFR